MNYNLRRLCRLSNPPLFPVARFVCRTVPLEKCYAIFKSATVPSHPVYMSHCSITVMICYFQIRHCFQSPSVPVALFHYSNYMLFSNPPLFPVTQCTCRTVPLSNDMLFSNPPLCADCRAMLLSAKYNAFL